MSGDTPTPVPAASERMTVDEVSAVIDRLRGEAHELRGEFGVILADTACWQAAFLLERLTARAEAAEARAETARDLLKQAESRLVYWMTEASPADTLEAAQRVQTMIDTNPVIMAIRALLTAPPPTAKESEA